MILKNIFLLVVVLSIFLISGCYVEIGDYEFQISKKESKNDVNNSSSKLIKKLIQDDVSKICKKKMIEEINFIKAKGPSQWTVDLVDYNTFNNKTQASEYVTKWKSSPYWITSNTLKYNSKDIDSIEEDKEFFIGVIKVDFGMYVGEYGSTYVAYTYPIICIDGKIGESSRTLLNTIK